jgi:WD40 repeat protein
MTTALDTRRLAAFLLACLPLLVTSVQGQADPPDKAAVAEPDAPAVGEQVGIWMPIPLPDGRRCVVPVSDGTVRIFALETGETEFVYTGHEGIVHGVAVAPDGATLASCGEDGTVRVWDVALGSSRAVHQAPRPLRPYWGDTLSYSPAGDQLVAVASGAWGEVWDVASGEPILTLPDEAETTFAKWTLDGRLVSVGLDGLVRVWDVAEGREVRSPLDVGERLGIVSCHPDGDRIATAGVWDTNVWIWNLETGERLGTVLAGKMPRSDLQSVEDIFFTPDGEDLILTAGGLHSVYVFDADTLELRWSIENRSGSAAPIRVALDHAGGRVGLSVLDRIVRREDGLDAPGSPVPAGFFQFSPGDEYVVARTSNVIVVLDGASLEVLYRRTEHVEGASRVTRAG